MPPTKQQMPSRPDAPMKDHVRYVRRNAASIVSRLSPSLAGKPALALCSCSALTPANQTDDLSHHRSIWSDSWPSLRSLASPA